MLARIRSEGGAGGRGRLRIYLGMAPGVGKTYRMLEEGHRRVERGTDVVVGFVETHGRPHTIELLDGLEVVPRRSTEYRGVVVEEMDTDGGHRATTDGRPGRRAGPHQRARGRRATSAGRTSSCIRDAGIHVVTTMNVQHLEGASDAVATITGAPVNERLPDDVLLTADEIELVDMSPHALRQRMKHGNVYPPERTQVALDRFFTESNLTALRELSLRLVARRVEGQLEDTIAGQRLPLVTDRVLVLVDGSPASGRAVRRAATLSSALRGGFIAVVVDTPAEARLSFDRRRDIQEVLDDAVDLGAEVVRVDAADVADGLADVARTHRATHVVLPHHEDSGVARLRRRPLADRLLERLPDVELHIVGPASGR